MDLERILAFLATLPATAVRAKGVLETLQSPGRRTVVQLVGRRLDITDDGPTTADQTSSLVLIDAGDDTARDLGAELRRCLAGPH